MDAATQTMIRNIEEKTGRSVDEWVAVLAGRKVEKHAQMVKLLKDEFGFTHGYANLVAHAARNGLEPQEAGTATEADLFAGRRAALRPVYDALVEAIAGLGPDVEIAPKKAYVSFRRKKQFAMAQPTTTRIDVGLNARGLEPGGRLESAAGFSAMCTHRVRIEAVEQVDDELLDWLRKAYRGAE